MSKHDDRMNTKVNCLVAIWYLYQWQIALQEIKFNQFNFMTQTPNTKAQFILFNISKRDLLNIRIELLEMSKKWI